MAFDNRDSIDFGKDRIPKLFSNLFIPTLLGMIADVAFILTDGIFVGHGVGQEGLASVNLVCPAMMLITAIGVMFGSGCSVVAAIHLAKENVKAARINMTQAFAASLALSLVLVAIFYSAPGKVLGLLGVSEELMAFAKEYFFWFIPTCVFIMVQIVGSFVIRLDGSPKYSMLATVVPSVINIVLDYVFIFICGWGLKGAAIATDIGTGVGMLMTFVYIFFLSNTLKVYKLKHTVTSLRLGLRNVGYMIKVGFPGFIGEFATSVMILAGNLAFGKYLSDSGIAAFSVICYLFPVVLNVYYAISSAAQPIISFNYGAGSVSRVRSTLRLSLVFSAAFALLALGVFCFFPASIISVFLESGSKTFGLASTGLPLFALAFLPMGVNLSIIGYFQSVERSVVAVILTLLRGFVLVVLSFLLMPKMAGVTGLWLAVPVSETITAILSIVLLLHSFARSH